MWGSVLILHRFKINAVEAAIISVPGYTAAESPPSPLRPSFRLKTWRNDGGYHQETHPRGGSFYRTIDGVAKSPIDGVITAKRPGTPNAQHTLCMPPLGQCHYALYVELLCLATFCGTMDFFQVHHNCPFSFPGKPESPAGQDSGGEGLPFSIAAGRLLASGIRVSRGKSPGRLRSSPSAVYGPPLAYKLIVLVSGDNL